MTTRKRSNFQHKAAQLAYVLFFLGIGLAALGQYGINNSALVAIGIIIIALSLIPAIIAYPWIISF